MENKMYCFQCQETAGNVACTQVGVCGKSAKTANLQDLLIDVTKGLASVLMQARKEMCIRDRCILLFSNLYQHKSLKDYIVEINRQRY